MTKLKALRALAIAALGGAVAVSAWARPVAAAHGDAAPESDPRVAVLDWELAQTVIALGVEPAAVAAAAGYREWVREPPLPVSTADLGRRPEPSLTALRAARPDLIVMSDHYDRGRERLEQIAPVLTQVMFAVDTDPIVRGREVARTLGERLGRDEAFEALLTRLHTSLGRLRERVRATQSAGDRVYLVQFRDANHVRVFGQGSVLHGVLKRVGLHNAWEGPTNVWGFALTELMRLDIAAEHIVVIEPLPRRAEEMMRESSLWRALPPVRHGRVHRLQPVWLGGGLPSTIRFARLLERALDDG